MPYIYRAALYCDTCGQEIRAMLDGPADRMTRRADLFYLAAGRALATGPHDNSYVLAAVACDARAYRLRPVPNYADEYSYDSHDYPKHTHDVGESDTPDHCDAGADCRERVDLQPFTSVNLDPADRYVGALIGDALTDYGVRYVQETATEPDRTARQRAIARAWIEHYNVPAPAEAIKSAEKAGADHGHADATWNLNGCGAEDAYRYLMLESAGEAYDYYPHPFSGEWSGGMTERRAAADAGWPTADEEITAAYEEAHAEAWTTEAWRSARAILPDDALQCVDAAEAWSHRDPRTVTYHDPDAGVTVTFTRDPRGPILGSVDRQRAAVTIDGRPVWVDPRWTPGFWHDGNDPTDAAYRIAAALNWTALAWEDRDPDRDDPATAETLAAVTRAADNAEELHHRLREWSPNR